MGRKFAKRKADREFWHDFDKEMTTVKMVKAHYESYDGHCELVVTIRRPLIDDYDWLVNEASQTIKNECYFDIQNSAFQPEPRLVWFDGKQHSWKTPPIPRDILDIEFDEDGNYDT